MWLFNICVPVFLVFGIGFLDARVSDDGYTLTEDFDQYDYMNQSVNPCEDFYEYTCGNFKNKYPLKNGKILIDQFTLLEEKLTSTVKKILNTEYEDEDPRALQKAKAAYQACVDEQYMNNAQLVAPEKLVVERYGGFPILQSPYLQESPFGWNDIADLAADFGISVFFAPYLYSDTANSSRNILRLSSDGMDIPVQLRTHIPDSYDTAIEEGFIALANGRVEETKGPLKSSSAKPVAQMELLLRTFVIKLRNIFGATISEDELFDKVANISNFMKGIYYQGYIPDGTVVDQITDDDTAQTVTLRQLNVWTKKQFGNTVQLDWVQYIKRLFKYTQVEIDEDFAIVYYLDLNRLLYGIINWVRMNDPAIVKSSVLLRTFVYMASDSDAVTRKDFTDYLKAIGKTVYDRQEYCARKLMDATGTLSLGLAATYEYQLNHFDKSNLEYANKLITDLKSSFKEIIEEADWMGDESKQAAQKKIDNLVTLLGYPNFVNDPLLLDNFYKHLEMTTWDHFENARWIRAFQQSYTLNMISKRDRKAWEKSPFDTNAYYNRQNNRIIFPIAMLNPTFFKGSGSLLDYGRIGMIIAHEITHGFDLQGFLYNPEGVITPWWSTETREKFTSLTGCFADQYSEYFIPEINSTISGNGSLNENVADNGGLRTAFKAFKKLISTLKKDDADRKTVTQFTPEQLFFVGYGSMWCSNEATSYLTDLKKTCDTSANCHFISKWRVNGVVSNMKEFSEAFNCPAGSPMNPVNKCRVW